MRRETGLESGLKLEAFSTVRQATSRARLTEVQNRKGTERVLEIHSRL